MNVYSHFLSITKTIYFYFQVCISYFKCKKPVALKHKNSTDEATEELLFISLVEESRKNIINFYCHVCSEDCLKDQTFLMHDKIFCSYACRNHYRKHLEESLIN